ncbi:sensor histidine kinase [Companilactobacillus farciminis]|uniref:sensor histidine kinase n=1 Tax=Companilactobacillus farciminis TaxID=1612 RepID=UPI00232FCC93|nr:GHKL domain-containing protein [Companilactobacillus farciminis]WCG35378.1 GHKL domain-containing protein [Companilactobacillus farciminis]
MEFILDSSFIFFVLTIYTNMNFERSFSNFVKNSVNSIFWGIMSLLFEDFTYILFLMLFIVKMILKEKTIKFSKNRTIVMMIALISEMIFSLFGSLIARIVNLNKPKDFFVLSLINVNDLKSVLGLIINLAFFIAALEIIRFNEEKIVYIEERVEYLNLSNQFFWMLFFILISFEVILFVGSLEQMTSVMNGTIFLIFISFLFFICWQMINLFRDFSVQQKLANELEQNRQLNEYLKSIQEQYDDLRRFKHDFKNIILSMSVASSENASKDYEELYRELTQQREFTNDLDGKIVSEYKKITNDPLRGLVIQKFFKAKSNSIKLNVEITDNYIQIDDGVLNVVRIVGILLDNAIEETSNGLNKNVDLAFVKNDDVLEISVENPLNHSVNIKNIFKKGYSTKGENHGIGLANVSELIDKDNNLYLDTEIIDDKLRITLMILNDFT